MEGSCSYALRISIDAPNQREKVRREGHSAPLAASPRNEGILFGEHRDSYHSSYTGFAPRWYTQELGKKAVASCACLQSFGPMVLSMRARTKRSHHDLLYHTFTERSHARVILLVGQVAWDGFLVRRVGLKAPVGTLEPYWMVTPEPPPAPESIGIASSYGSSCVVKDSNLVDPASSHTLVSKIKPCMSK